MTFSGPSFRSSPPRTAPARRPSPAGGDPSGALRRSTSTLLASTPTTSSASPSSPGSSRITLAPPAALPSTASASQSEKKGTPRMPLRSRAGSTPDPSTASRSLTSASGSYGQSEKRYPLSPSVLRRAATLNMARIGLCDFPKEVAPSLNFPLLKQLTMWRISISDVVFRGLLSSCPVLEALKLEEFRCVGCLRISSPTLRIIVIDVLFRGKGELIIEDTPSLERLLLPSPGLSREIIRVLRAPKLEILGLLSPCISEIEIANLVFQGFAPSSMKNKIHTVKVLALEFPRPDLNAVLQILRCFPCLEKLYVIWDDYSKTVMKNVPQYDPLDPLKCLESHLKVVVLKNYEGGVEDVSFAKFFVLNAKVVKEIKFGVCKNIDIDMKWMTDQHRLLEVETRASRDALLKFKSVSSSENRLDTQDLSIADPAIL